MRPMSSIEKLLYTVPVSLIVPFGPCLLASDKMFHMDTSIWSFDMEIYLHLMYGVVFESS